MASFTENLSKQTHKKRDKHNAEYLSDQRQLDKFKDLILSINQFERYSYALTSQTCEVKCANYYGLLCEFLKLMAIKARLKQVNGSKFIESLTNI